MTAIVGAEYLIAFGLIKALSEGDNAISFSRLRALANQIQERFNAVSVDAVIVDYNLQEAICDYDQYFDFVILNRVPYAICKAGISVQDLKQRFAENLSEEVRCAMECPGVGRANAEG